MAKQELRTNEAIRVREVRLVGSDGEQLGIVPTLEALKMANEQGVDLVEVAPQAKPPVCKLLDYGKFKFEQEKNAQEARKKQKLLKMKEVRMQPKIETHDLEFKTRHIQEFLEAGSKVKVTIRFRGRELAHTELRKSRSRSNTGIVGHSVSGGSETGDGGAIHVDDSIPERQG